MVLGHPGFNWLFLFASVFSATPFKVLNESFFNSTGFFFMVNNLKETFGICSYNF